MADHHYYKTHCKVRSLEGDRIEISGPDIFTGETFSVCIESIEYDALESGLEFQEAIKSITPEEREFLISGLAPSSFPPEPIEDLPTIEDPPKVGMPMPFDDANAIAQKNPGSRLKRCGGDGFVVTDKNGNFLTS